jgi:hypothetical protein
MRYSTDKCVIASAGCQVDMKALQKLLQSCNVMFQHNHGKPMSCKGAAQLLSNTLYYKRFFPYYTFNLCAGLDEEGESRRRHIWWQHNFMCCRVLHARMSVVHVERSIHNLKFWALHVAVQCSYDEHSRWSRVH